MRDVLTAMIKAHEVQGVLALQNSFNRVGLDHVLLVRIATTAVVTGMLGGGKEEIINAVSNAWIDGGALRTYRHAPITGSRKSWAAGDATGRGVWLALMAMAGEMGYPSALSAEGWGFYDVLFGGKSFEFPQGYGSYVMENVLFKISFPAEFHAQTAVEAAIELHDEAKDRIGEIEKIKLTTHESAIRIIDKTGPLHNPADRDHCLQYMVAVPLIFGQLTADDYEDERAQDPRIDELREKMEVVEDERYSEDYLDPDKLSIANAVQVHFEDGSSTEEVEVRVPRRSPSAPRRGHTVIAGEVLEQPQGSFPGAAVGGNPGTLPRWRKAREDPGQRVHGTADHMRTKYQRERIEHGTRYSGKQKLELRRFSGQSKTWEIDPWRGDPHVDERRTIPTGIQRGSCPTLPFLGQIDFAGGAGTRDIQRLLEEMEPAGRDR